MILNSSLRDKASMKIGMVCGMRIWFDIIMFLMVEK